MTCRKSLEQRVLSVPSSENQDNDDSLLIAARGARELAYARFSQFNVGAAVRTSSGEVITGCNIENSSYGLTMCAERVAIFTAVAQGFRKLERLAVTTPEHPGGPVAAKMPCGACRQVMAEFMDLTAKIDVGGVGTYVLEELLPHPFCLESET